MADRCSLFVNNESVDGMRVLTWAFLPLTASVKQITRSCEDRQEEVQPRTAARSSGFVCGMPSLVGQHSSAFVFTFIFRLILESRVFPFLPQCVSGPVWGFSELAPPWGAHVARVLTKPQPPPVQRLQRVEKSVLFCPVIMSCWCESEHGGRGSMLVSVELWPS